MEYFLGTRSASFISTNAECVSRYEARSVMSDSCFELFFIITSKGEQYFLYLYLSTLDVICQENCGLVKTLEGFGSKKVGFNNKAIISGRKAITSH